MHDWIDSIEPENEIANWDSPVYFYDLIVISIFSGKLKLNFTSIFSFNF